MFIYSNWLNHVGFTQDQIDALDNTMNHFELRVTNLEKIVTGVGQIDLTEFIEAAEAIIEGNVIPDVALLKESKDLMEGELNTLKSQLQEGTELNETKFEAIQQALDALTGYDDEDLLAAIARIDLTISQLDVPGLRNDLNALKESIDSDTRVEDLRTELNGVKTRLNELSNYNDTELRGLIADVDRKVMAIDLKPLTQAIDNVSGRIKAVEDQGLEGKIFELAAQLNALQIPDAYNDQEIRGQIGDVKLTITQIQGQLDALNLAGYDDTEVRGLIAAANDQIGFMEERIAQLEADIIALNGRDFSEEIEELRQRIENIVIPEPYNDTNVRNEISFVKDDLQILSRDVELLATQGYDDSELRMMIGNLEDLIEAIEVGDTYDDTELRAELRSIKQMLDSMTTGEIDLSEFINRLSVLEKDMESVKASTGNLTTQLGELNAIVEDIEAADLSEINAALAAMQVEINDLKSQLGDTTLGSDVEALKQAVTDMRAQITELQENGGSAGDIDPGVITDLQQRVEDLATIVEGLSNNGGTPSLVKVNGSSPVFVPGGTNNGLVKQGLAGFDIIDMNQVTSAQDSGLKRVYDIVTTEEDWGSTKKSTYAKALLITASGNVGNAGDLGFQLLIFYLTNRTFTRTKSDFAGRWTAFKELTSTPLP